MIKKFWPLNIFILLAFFVPSFSLAATGLPPIKDVSYKGTFIKQSIPDPIVFKPGETKVIDVTYKNSGVATWEKDGKNYVSVYTVMPSLHDSQFANSTWLTRNQPARLLTKTLPGGKAVFSISLTAPQKPGEYQEDFYLAAENKTWIKGTHFYFVIIVEPESIKSDEASVTVDAFEPGTPTDTPSLVTSSRELIAEPNIRVGIYKTADDVQFISDYAYDVYNGNEFIGALLPGKPAIITYHDGVYGFSSADTQFTTDQPIRLVAATAESVFALPSVTRTLAGHQGRNYNIYRGTFEYRYSAKSALPYIINELPLEQYVAGIGEASNDVPSEYAKALLIAARSYAYTNIRHQPPTATNLFDVYATTQDQLYLGYIFEKANPKIKAAAEATRGEMVTYETRPVTTYYFGHSDGKTRAAKPAKPWLTSVSAKYDIGLTMWGHGVGMSSRDAMLRAKKDGWSYTEILKHYYTGTTVEKIY